MSNRQGVADCPMENVKVMKGLKLASLTVALVADNYVITDEHPPVLYIDPGATARDVLLPAIDENSAGLTFLIFNTGTATETITLKTSADGAITPAPAIVGNEGLIVTNDGTTWRSLVGANT